VCISRPPTVINRRIGHAHAGPRRLPTHFSIFLNLARYGWPCYPVGRSALLENIKPKWPSDSPAGFLHPCYIYLYHLFKLMSTTCRNSWPSWFNLIPEFNIRLISRWSDFIRSTKTTCARAYFCPPRVGEKGSLICSLVEF